MFIQVEQELFSLNCICWRKHSPAIACHSQLTSRNVESELERIYFAANRIYNKWKEVK